MVNGKWYMAKNKCSIELKVFEINGSNVYVKSDFSVND